MKPRPMYPKITKNTFNSESTYPKITKKYITSVVHEMHIWMNDTWSENDFLITEADMVEVIQSYIKVLSKKFSTPSYESSVVNFIERLSQYIPDTCEDQETVESYKNINDTCIIEEFIYWYNIN